MTRTYEAGLKIAKSQGLDEREQKLFAETLTLEYNINVMRDSQFTINDIDGFLSSMEDFERKPEDKHINGKVKSRNGKTTITSDEILPKDLRSADVEIRLTKIEKPKPIKMQIKTFMIDNESVKVFTSFGNNVGNFPYPQEDIDFCRIMNMFAGKTVRITVEEIPK
jgi:hypothetical protein